MTSYVSEMTYFVSSEKLNHNSINLVTLYLSVVTTQALIWTENKEIICLSIFLELGWSNYSFRNL